MAMKAQATVDAYLNALPDDQREKLQNVRATVKAQVPDAVESMSYGLPTFKYRGKPLIYFGAAKQHLALYGAVWASMDPADLAKYDVSKGTIRFPLNKPIPATLVRKVVKARRAEIDAEAAVKKMQPRSKR
jgi:uncharacterized protein YdhG (YjbR/CyaY superfamily)